MSAAQREDRDTVAMPRDRLLGLLEESTLPDPYEGVSPVAVLAVIGLFIALFIAVLQLN